MHRQIPYSHVYRIPLEVNENIAPLIESELLTSATRDRLPSSLKTSLPEEAFFVDTPKIDSNPLIGEPHIFIFDPTKPDIPNYREVMNPRWERITRELSIVRLYIHDDYRQHEQAIMKAFPHEAKGRTTHY